MLCSALFPLQLKRIFCYPFPLPKLGDVGITAFDQITQGTCVAAFKVLMKLADGSEIVVEVIHKDSRAKCLVGCDSGNDMSSCPQGFELKTVGDMSVSLL